VNDSLIKYRKGQLQMPNIIKGSFEYHEDGSLFFIKEGGGALPDIKWSSDVYIVNSPIVCHGFMMLIYDEKTDKNKLAGITDMMALTPVHILIPEIVPQG